MTTDHQKTDHQVKDHQKTIPYGHVIDISHSEDSGEKEMATNQEVRTPSNDIGTEKYVMHAHFEVLYIYNLL